MKFDPDVHSKALIAAEQASHAVSTLLTFGNDDYWSEDGVVELLAEALKLSVEVVAEARPVVDHTSEARDELLATLRRFLGEGEGCEPARGDASKPLEEAGR